MASDFKQIIKALSDANARFVVVGGMAMVSHGSSFVTADLDICYDRAPDNLQVIQTALSPLNPRLRGAPENLPFRLDVPTLRAGLNFTLVTDAGDLDLMGELTGVGGYEQLLPGAMKLDLYGFPILVMGLDDLIRAKEAAGREKDRLHLGELREIRKRLGHQGPPQ